jgi:diguanylate cyclase (GGDEF)-like protein
MAPQFFILVALMLTSIVLAVALFLAWRDFGRPRHALFWAGAFAVGALQWACNLAQSFLFDDRRVYWVVVNAIPLLILSLALLGHRVRVGWSNNWRALLLLALAVEAAVVWFTVVQPHVGLNMAIQPAYAGLMLLATAYTVWRGGQRQTAELAVVAANGAFGLVELAAAGAALAQGATVQEPYLSWYLRINFLLLPSGYVGCGVFVIFLLASDLSEAMRRLARTDQLTQLLNRRGFDSAAQRLLAHARAQGQTLSLVLCDIDHFKQINDRYGHEQGDRAIEAFAAHLRRASPAATPVARLGGEEFALMLPGLNANAALAAAEQLRAQLATLAMPAGTQALRLSASFGVAELRDEDRDIYDTLRRADRALYAAKHAGRDRVELAASV